jgi:hypothetical protein
MHSNGPSGRVTNSTGDVDLDGQLVGRLADLLEARDRRLAASITATSDVLAAAQLIGIRRMLRHLPEVRS